MNHDKQKLRDWSASVFDFTLLLDDDSTIEVRNSLGDIIRWERNRDERWMSKAPGVEGLVYLAYLAGRRTGQIAEPHFDNWHPHLIDLDAEKVLRRKDGSEAEADDLDEVDGPGLADPTGPARSDAG